MIPVQQESILFAQTDFIYLPDRAKMIPNWTAITPSMALPAQ